MVKHSPIASIQHTLELKYAITQFLENGMEVDENIDGKDDEDISDGKVVGIGKNMFPTTHPHFWLFPCMLFLLRVVLRGVRNCAHC